MAEENKKTKVEEQRKKEKVNSEEKKKAKTDVVNDMKKTEETKTGEKQPEKESKETKTEDKKEEKPVEEKKEDSDKKPEKKVVKEEKVKKESVSVNLSNLPVSTKHSKAICKFIKNKKIGDAIADLEQVSVAKKSVPMKGEIPHRKGKGMMSGRFPKKASQSFLKILRSLAANSSYNGIEDPVIVEAIANIGERPYGKFGRVRMKRTHVRVVAKSMEKNKK